MTVVGGLSMLMANNDESCLPCTPEEEKRIINHLNQQSSPIKEGDTYYILSNRWYMEWLKYTVQDAEEHSQAAPPRPAQIDNHHLVDTNHKGDDLQILRSAQEGTDYVLVPLDVWKKLYDWYKGGPALPRKVISQGIQNMPSVEVHPLHLHVIDSRDEKVYNIFMSKKASLHYLYNEVKKLLWLEAEKLLIWDYFGKLKSQKFIASNKSLEEAGVMIDHDILVEVENPEAQPLFGMDSTGNGLALVPVVSPLSSVTIAGGPTSSNGDSTGYTSTYYSRNSYNSPVTDNEDPFNLGEVTKGDKGGLAGLQNLGNTCFMNSALQCLVHTPPLVEYFMQDYSDEINKENPIGMKGELAIAFGALLRKVWSSRGAPVAPREFKTKLARFAPQFSGYNQHDSQELLAFLLDGLHEDLNRVKLKPYIELKDANGRPDDEVANECWEIHKARNDSVIVDVCQGQYKSTLVCPVCNKVSVTFDPFMYLTLPLPSKVTRSMTVTVFSGNGSALPIPYTVKVLQNGTFKTLIEALSIECCLGIDETLMLAEVYDHHIFKYLENPSDPLSHIKDEDYIVAYRLPKKQEGYTKLVIVHEQHEEKKLGAPLVTYLAQGSQTSADVQNAVHMVLNPLLKVKPTHSSLNLGGHDNGLEEVDDDDEVVVKEEGSAAASPSDMEIPNTESDDKMEVDHVFNLSASPDDNVYRCRPIKESDSATQTVTVDWSERDLDMYNLSYLENLPAACKPTKKAARRDSISLFSCLEAFLKEEPLGPDDMWFCPSCKEHRQASKKLDLWRLPEILVVHLKRFSYSRWSKNKLDTFVDFPTKNLDLKQYVKSSMTAAAAQQSSYNYELYAVSNHYGGLGGGHYSANAKVDEERWYHFDDSHVSPIREEEIKTSAAYVLFYRRVKDQNEDSSSQAPVSSSSSSSG
ncbi:ubiquitinyl hydrolase 1 [Ranunculus cassubicifolius]